MLVSEKFATPQLNILKSKCESCRVGKYRGQRLCLKSPSSHCDRKCQSFVRLWSHIGAEPFDCRAAIARKRRPNCQISEDEEELPRQDDEDKSNDAPLRLSFVSHADQTIPALPGPTCSGPWTAGSSQISQGMVRRK